MLNSQETPTHRDNGLGLYDENDNIAAPGNEVPLVVLDGVLAVDLIDVSSHVFINANLAVDPESCVRRDVRSAGQNAQGGEEGRINLRVIFEMLQAQQAAIAQLQNQNHAPGRFEPEPSQEVVCRAKSVPKRSNGDELENDPAIMKMLAELTKQVESGEKKIEANNKKVETHNCRVD